jgi:hypothetical protein
MQEQVEDEVYFSGDFCPMEEESMPETALHAKLIQYLVEVLEWLFRGRLCAIHRNLAFYQAPERKAPPVAPDIAVIRCGGEARFLCTHGCARVFRLNSQLRLTGEQAAERRAEALAEKLRSLGIDPDQV